MADTLVIIPVVTAMVGTSVGASEPKIVRGDSLSFSEQLNLNGSGCLPHTALHRRLSFLVSLHMRRKNPSNNDGQIFLISENAGGEGVDNGRHGQWAGVVVVF